MIAVLGLGFVGLTTGLGFAEKGFQVYGFDVDEKKRNRLKSGEVPFYEPMLVEKLEEYSSNRFIIADDLKTAVEGAEIVFLCVGTPQSDDGKAYLGYLESAIKDTLSHCTDKSRKVLVVKSTVPPSTTKKQVAPMIEKEGFRLGTEIGLATNPEFLREGFAWEDFVFPDRVVVGVSDEQTEESLKKVYEPFGAPFHAVSWNSAEYIKYLSNTLLSTLISYSNEMAMLGIEIGDIDVPGAFRILHEDKRWSGEPAKMTSYVYPGCGFGGYCLPKDTAAMIAKGQEYGADSSILPSVLSVNEKIKSFWADKVFSELGNKATIGILGLSFKPDSDDVRMTPAADIIQGLINKGFKSILAYDPLATDLFRSQYDFPIIYCDSMEEVLGKADAVAVVTAWKEFRESQELKRYKKVFDLRFCLS